ncbi:MAG: phage major capsid protein [Oscillospiraceae bacterium]|nr:phage major capsid protein [Oscillospiraceae bacterium]
MRTLADIQARLKAISEEIESRGETITSEDLAKLETEVAELNEERKTIIADAEKRQKLLSDIAEGNTETRTITQMNSLIASGAGESSGSGATVEDRFDTPAYQRHFMEHVCRGTPMPDEYRMLALEMRADAFSQTGDVGAVIPTTIMNEIIREATTFGQLFSRVRRLSIQGGVAFPILDLVPEASWITESKVSDTQKLTAKKSVVFNYHGLECRLSQSLLVSIVTLAEFQRLFVPLAAEAMVKALEISMVNGDGAGQMMGILNETRIPAKNKITLSPTEFGSWGEWKKKVFAAMKISYRNGSFIMAQGTFDGYIDGMVDLNSQPIGRVNYGIDGGETYRFGGRRIIPVEDAILPAYEDAKVGDVVAIFMRLQDYAINTNMQMRMVHWLDHNDNKVKNKAIMVADGKVIDPHGILLIKKGGDVEPPTDPPTP